MENNKLYHLKNDFGDYNKIITENEVDEIKKIFADECLQCAKNNLACNDEESINNALCWIDKATKGLFTYDIDYMINELNKEHNWLIDVYVRV